MNLKYLKNNRILFYSLSLLPLIIPMSLVGEVTPEDGDWSEKTIVMVNIANKSGWITPNSKLFVIL